MFVAALLTLVVLMGIYEGCTAPGIRKSLGNFALWLLSRSVYFFCVLVVAATVGRYISHAGERALKEAKIDQSRVIAVTEKIEWREKNSRWWGETIYEMSTPRGDNTFVSVPHFHYEPITEIAVGIVGTLLALTCSFVVLIARWWRSRRARLRVDTST